MADTFTPNLLLRLPDFNGPADVRTLLTDLGTIDTAVGGTVNVREPRFAADPTGVLDAGPAINAALAAALAAGGGVVYVPAGTYLIATQIVFPGSGLTLRGAGIGRTILKDSSVFAAGGIVWAVGRSNITLADMTIQPQATSGSYGFYIEGTSTQITDILVERVLVDQLKANASGAVITGGAGGMRRVAVKGCHVRSPVGGTGTFGLGFGCGDTGTFSYEGLVQDSIFEGFTDAFRQTTPGTWIQVKVASCVFKFARQHGAFFYHMGRLLLTNSEFVSNDAGAYFTDGAGNQGVQVSNCHFDNNTTLGAYHADLSSATFANCDFQANGYGLWLSSGTNCAYSGCSFTFNTRDGILVDRGATITSLLNGAVSYHLVVQTYVQHVVLSGCVIAVNDRNGITIKGAQRSFKLEGCIVAGNGQADSGIGPTNYAELWVQVDALGGNTYAVEIDGCVFGNVAGSGTYTGYALHGVKTDAGVISDIAVRNSRFEALTNGITVPSATRSLVVGCQFVGVAAVALPAGCFWRANTITGGGAVGYAESVEAGLSLTGLLTFLTAAAKVVAGATSLAFWNAANTFANLTIADAGAVTIHRGKLTVTTGGIEATAGDITAASGAVQTKRGANVTAANNLVLTRDGNCWQISGATQINLIDTTGWQDGAVVRLVFLGAPTVKHNQLLSGTNVPILLAGSVDFVASANDVLTLMRIGNTWYEVSRCVI